jgi:hypothetical protein
VTVETGEPSGSPRKPLSDARLAEKFRDCAAHAAKPVDADPLIDAILSLETLPGLTALWQ